MLINIFGDRDIVKVGLWLQVNGYFENNKKLMVRWVFYCLIAFGLQWYILLLVTFEFVKTGLEETGATE